MADPPEQREQQEDAGVHAWRKYVQSFLDRNDMTAADLARSSGVSPQVLSSILRDGRDQLVHRPDQRTVEMLATAMRVESDDLLAAVAEAMGLPVGRTIVVADASLVSNAELIRVLSERLRLTEDAADEPHPTGS